MRPPTLRMAMNGDHDPDGGKLIHSSHSTEAEEALSHALGTRTTAAA